MPIPGARYRFKPIHGGKLRLAFVGSKVVEIAIFKHGKRKKVVHLHKRKRRK